MTFITSLQSRVWEIVSVASVVTEIIGLVKICKSCGAGPVSVIPIKNRHIVESVCSRRSDGVDVERPIER